MRNNVSRFFTLITLLWLIAVFCTACTTAWTGEAINIINLLGPAITSAIAILAGFGVGVPSATLNAINAWAAQANDVLKSVAGLIEQYNNAEASAKPGLLTEIQTALGVIVANASTLLPEIRISNPKTQEKILAIFNAVLAELDGLINLVPALKGEVTSHHELKALMKQVKSHQEFKSEFNAQVEEFGAQYKI